jgi:outer membrane protein assembly factor BamB
MFVWMSRTHPHHSIKFVIVFAILGAGSVAAQNPLFTEKCSVCHGAEAKGGDRGPVLANNRRLGTRLVEDLMASSGDVDGLVFYGESGGAFAAVDAKNGKTLWHFGAGGIFKASPITYTVAGRQYVAIASGANIIAFALP